MPEMNNIIHVLPSQYSDINTSICDKLRARLIDQIYFVDTETENLLLGLSIHADDVYRLEISIPFYWKMV